MSDHSSCCRIHNDRANRSARIKDSSVQMARPAPFSSSSTNAPASAQTVPVIFASSSMPSATAASRPAGARISARSETGSGEGSSTGTRSVKRLAPPRNLVVD